MLSADQQRQLTEIEAGTPMGELLRRYWYPVAASCQLEPCSSRSARLLGEQLVLFRDQEGQLGLLEDRCPHRGVSLSYGIVEEGRLVCPYHGWSFDRNGACRAMPAEPSGSPLRDRVSVRSYRVEELGGMIFAYLGPEPAPLLPRFDLFVWDHCVRDIGQATLPCHWLQIMENSVDPLHLEALHGHHLRAMRARKGLTAPTHYLRRHRKVAFDRFEYGIVKRRLLEGESESCDDWTIGHPLVFPHMVRLGAGAQHRMQIRVPLDGTTTWHLWYGCYRAAPQASPPKQHVIPLYDVPWLDAGGRHITDSVDGQDIMTWVTQGPVADRTREILATSDRGIVLLRTLLFEQMERVRQGLDPMGLIRSPGDNRCIVLPLEKEKYGHGREFLAESMTMGHARYSPLLPQILELLAVGE